MRKHGFKRPFHLFQKILWIFLISLLILNEISISPILKEQVQAIYATFYHVSLTFAVVFGFFATYINPTDNISRSGFKLENKKNLTYCSICKSSRYFHSKHCSKCNRCVEGFDHHCKWINNCIGKKNYKCFFFSLVALTINMLVVLCIISIILIDFFMEDSDLKMNTKERVKSFENDGAWITEVMILACSCLVCIVMSLNLLGFHIWIMYKGITTYDYMKKKMQRLGDSRINMNIVHRNETSINKFETGEKD